MRGGDKGRIGGMMAFEEFPLVGGELTGECEATCGLPRTKFSNSGWITCGALAPATIDMRETAACGPGCGTSSVAGPVAGEFGGRSVPGLEGGALLGYTISTAQVVLYDKST